MASIKRVFAILLTPALLLTLLPRLSIGANAEVVVDEGYSIVSTLDTDTGILTVSGTGEMDRWVIDDKYKPLIREVRLSEGITGIDYATFYGYSALSAVSLPESLTYIDFEAFQNSALYDDKSNWEDGFFYVGRWLVATERDIESAKVREGTLGLGYNAFCGCYALSEVTLPEGLRYIGDSAFSQSYGYTRLSIPASVVSIGKHAFWGTGTLRELDVSPDNPAYSSEDGVLFDKDKKTLLFYPPGKSGAYTIPDGVTAVAEEAFYDCDLLTELTLPASVNSIAERAISSCYELRRVRILNPRCEIHKSGVYLPNANAVIYGAPASTAQSYAEMRGYPFFSLFTDVSDAAYYAAAVKWATEQGVTVGVGDSRFDPNGVCTRGQVVTFLWRAMGEPVPSGTEQHFSDVKKSSFCSKAVLWAEETGVTLGVGGNRFNPNGVCTRAQVVTFLWRAMGEPAPKSRDNPFSDVGRKAYYADAVLWAAENGIAQGISAERFVPDEICTRAQVVTFLYRARQNVQPVQSCEVGISLPTRRSRYWERGGREIDRLLRKDGYTVSLRFAENDPALQAAQVESMLDNGARVLIIACLDSNALAGALERAKEAGCTVIDYNYVSYSDATAYYTSFSRYDVGVLQGKYIEQALNLPAGGSYNIEFMGGDPGFGEPGGRSYWEGMMKVLEPYLDAGTLVCPSDQIDYYYNAVEGSSPERAQERFENLLSTYYADKRLDAVWCADDYVAQGAAAALKTAYGKDNYPILTGQYCDVASVKNILEGKQAMSVLCDGYALGAKAAQMAEAILQGREVPVNTELTTPDGRYTYPALICEPTVVTKDNYRQVLIDTGYYTEAELTP